MNIHELRGCRAGIGAFKCIDLFRSFREQKRGASDVIAKKQTSSFMFSN